MKPSDPICAGAVLLLLAGACVRAVPVLTMPDSPIYRQAVREEVARHALDAELCYHTAFQTPAPSGRVRLGFLISGDGEVLHAEIEGAAFESKDFSECMVAMAMRLHFPPPPTQRESVRVSFPYLFAASATE